jgi:hypothetical protein
MKREYRALKSDSFHQRSKRQKANEKRVRMGVRVEHVWAKG